MSRASLHHRPNRHSGDNLSELLNPLDILTGEGLSGDAPGWLLNEADGESNLVASGLDRVGELDQGEVRNLAREETPFRARHGNSWARLSSTKLGVTPRAAKIPSESLPTSWRGC